MKATYGLSGWANKSLCSVFYSVPSPFCHNSPGKAPSLLRYHNVDSCSKVLPRLTEGFVLVRNKFCCIKPLRLFNMIAQFSLCTLKITWSKKSWNWLVPSWLIYSEAPHSFIFLICNTVQCALKDLSQNQINGYTFFWALLRTNWQHCKIFEACTSNFNQNLEIANLEYG